MVNDIGTWGTCNACTMKIFLNKDGAFREKPRETGSNTLYYLCTPLDRTFEYTAEQIRAKARKGGIFPWDHVSTDRQSFQPIQELEEFTELFKDFTVSANPYCCNHRERHAVTECPQCSRSYCPDCTKEKSVGVKTIRTCPACWASLDETDLRWMEKPFYKDLSRVLLYPFSNMAWVTTIGVGVLLWIARLMFIFGIPLYLIALSYIVQVILSSSKGEKEMTWGPDFTDPFSLIGRGFMAVVVTIAILIPFIFLNVFVLGNSLSFMTMNPLLKAVMVLALNIPLYVLALIYYPMALGMVAIWDNYWIAFRPDYVIEHILKIRNDYLVVLIAFFILSIIQIPYRVVLVLFPLVGSLVASILNTYIYIIMAHILGWTLYLNEKKLGWD